MPSLAVVTVAVLLLECAVFEVGLSQEDLVTTKKTLKKLLAGEISKALDDFTCSAPESTTAQCTLRRIEEAVGRIEDALTSHSTAAPLPSLSKIDEAVDRIEDKTDNGSTDSLLPSLSDTLRRLESMMENHAIQIQQVINKTDDLTTKLNSLQEQMEKLHHYGSVPHHAANSCTEILSHSSTASSGYYWVKNSTGHPTKMYCARSCGGIDGDWTRIGYLDMTSEGHNCPGRLNRLTHLNRSVCGGKTIACLSAMYTVDNIEYSEVCGRATAYARATVDGFHGYARIGRAQSINSNYVDGISLTHGNSPRKHIWTFSARAHDCFCGITPESVAEHYFCDRGDGPLWDGEECGTNTCCTLHNPPWFHRELPQPTNDDIELRLCLDQSISDENVLLELVEIYVK